MIAKLIFIFILTSMCTFASANIDLKILLGPYPPIGSPEEQLDFKQMMDLQQSRTKADCDQASSEVKANLQNFFGGTKGPLSAAEITKVKKKFTFLYLKSGADIIITKSSFKRPRPFLTHPEIKPCIALEKSKSYPSGHAAMSKMYARVLAEIFPERKIQLLQRADEVAMNRVLGGVHYPSDIIAGKKLGDELADDYLRSDDFDHGLREMYND